MIDPLTAFAAVKTGLSAGKQLHSLSKQLMSFYDSCDEAKLKHSKAKNSLFASSNEEAMNTWMHRQSAAECENELREIIVNSRGYSAYQELLALRREAIRERKEAERKRKLEEKARNEAVLAVFILLTSLSVGVSVIWWIGGRLGKW